MKILLTGSNGQLGHDFKKIFDKKNIEYIATDYKELDITNDGDLNRFFQENEGITHVINCAAYNDVDKTETDKKVWLLNAKAPKKLSEFSRVYIILCKLIDEFSKFNTLPFYLHKNFYTLENDKEERRVW